MSRHSKLWDLREPDEVVTWSPAQPPQAVEGPLPLDMFRDRMLVLDLAPGQVAVHVKGDGRQRVYFDTMPQLDLGLGAHQTAPEGWLVFLRSDAPIRWRWHDQSRLVVDLGGGAADELPLRGRCSVLVADPLRFHEAVLNGVDDLPAERLAGVLDTLVRARLEARIGGLVEGHHLDTLRAKIALEGLTATDLDDDLQALGLRCQDLVLAVPEPQDRAEASQMDEPRACYDDVF